MTMPGKIETNPTVADHRRRRQIPTYPGKINANPIRVQGGRRSRSPRATIGG